MRVVHRDSQRPVRHVLAAGDGGHDVGGYPTTELLETGTLGGSKLKLDTLLCASGVDVFGASGVGVGGNAAPTQVAKATIVYRLMQRQAAAAVLG